MKTMENPLPGIDESNLPEASQPWEMTADYRFQMARENLMYFVYHLEAMDGVCYVHTMDPAAGIARVMVAWGWEKTFDEMVKKLGGEFSLVRLSGPDYS
ncbi:MAG: hypothetical protein CVV64_07030 [Candidatus Wallbacteria bacterium HGW-Wallbacteria-1]|uniref:DUF4911 domain-containing protein n=1 Tax=Candidatus Wallbacteria bacterium HGW-Wallbacteria-1 TaxID=2013854 RepID=A0A2N1PT99_9BACT|nr:MAG: hypothetical protein CVV64_07030 [Candidatus Wallbacteria bacterium HGW-Wallbacteria-1]